VVTQLAPIVGTQTICHALAVPRASYYRFKNPAPPAEAEKVVVHTHPRALPQAEKSQVIDTLNCNRFRDLAIPQVFALLLDDGIYLCSQRSMYRYLHAVGQVQERRNQLSHPPHARPELVATAPNQIWSWDITKLKGPQKWSCFYLYVVLDIFSRYAVGWMLATSQSTALAERLLEETFLRYAISPGRLTVHSDRGAPMIAKPLALLLADLGVSRSFSRPRVSNDNPFSESHFKTLKYRPDFPVRFGSIEHGRAFCRTFFDWYNTQHRHSGIAYLTPAMVHFSQAQATLHQRQTTLDAAYARHPDRFVKGPPKVQQLPDAVWINPPLAEEIPGASPLDDALALNIPSNSYRATTSPQTHSNNLRYQLVNPICHLRPR
jgi:putative transposase